MREISLMILRVQRHLSNLNSANVNKTIIWPATTNTTIPKIPSFRNYISASSSPSQSRKLPSLQFHSTLCSSIDPDGPSKSNFVVINSTEEFNSSLSKVKGRDFSPVIGELSAKYPHITTYKIDIELEGLESTVRKLYINAVPTLLFFQQGEKVAELVGAHAPSLRTTMKQLYKKD